MTKVQMKRCSIANVLYIYNIDLLVTLPSRSLHYNLKEIMVRLVSHANTNHQTIRHPFYFQEFDYGINLIIPTVTVLYICDQKQKNGKSNKLVIFLVFFLVKPTLIYFLLHSDLYLLVSIFKLKSLNSLLPLKQQQ